MSVSPKVDEDNIKLFPYTKVYDSPCDYQKPETFSYDEHFVSLMKITHYKMLGRDTKKLMDLINVNYQIGERAQMRALVEKAGTIENMVRYLKETFPWKNESDILSSVQEVFKNIQNFISKS